jgi:hypothetical protein
MRMHEGSTTLQMCEGKIRSPKGVLLKGIGGREILEVNRRLRHQRKRVDGQKGGDIWGVLEMFLEWEVPAGF